MAVLILKFIGICILTWFVVEGSTPLQVIKNLLKVGEQSKTSNIWHEGIKTLFNCSKCLGFWIGLIYYQSIEFACLTSIGSEIFYRIWNRFFVPL